MRLVIVRSGKPKFKDSLFLRDADTGEWIAKLYGHDGQPHAANARLIVDAVAEYLRTRFRCGACGTIATLNEACACADDCTQDGG